MFLRQIVDPRLAQYAYLVGCPDAGRAVIVDPERDVERYHRIADDQGLEIVAAVETHIHADFLSGARELAAAGLRVYLSAEGGPDWRYAWAREKEYDVVLLGDGDSFPVGNVELHALHTPGHTPEHLSFLVHDRAGGAEGPMGILSGDFVFVGDVGRPDLLESAGGVEGAMREGAEALYGSLKRFLDLPDWLQVWPGHGAGSACGKSMGAVPTSTVGWERRSSPAVEAARRGERAFVEYVLEDQMEPPLYFGRMKIRNREGPRLLDALPRPAEVPSTAIATLREEEGVVIVDAREGPAGFMAAHLPGALHAPFDDTFPTTAGSYLGEEDRIVLVLDEHRLEDAVRCLVRIGLDRVEGFIRPHALEAYANGGGHLGRIEEIRVEALERRRRQGGTAVLDVRRLSEYREGHVPGALNIAHTRLLERMGELPKDRELLVHCSTGVRSAAAVALLARHGFDVVWVDGPLDAWMERHEPEAGPPPGERTAA